MKKIKVNENILALLMFASIFAGWPYLIVVTAFIWAFCEVGKSLQKLTVKIISVFGALAIIDLGWDLIVQGVDMTFGGLNRFFSMLVSWGVSPELVTNATRYAFTPIDLLVQIFGSILTFLLLLAKIKFIVEIIANKNATTIWPFKGFAEKIEDFANNRFYEEDKAAKEPTKSAEKSKFCPKCGTKLEGDSKFCPACGEKI